MNFSIFGLGNVGSGLFNIFKKKEKYFTFSKKNRFNCSLKNNFLDYTKLFFKNNTFIELIGGISSSLEIILNSLKNKNNFITANKEIISKYSFTLFYLFKINNKKIFFEASVCGSMPLIYLFENFFTIDNILYIIGIFNGTSNFVLSNYKKKNFLNLIKDSIKKGFAEKNYFNDLLGLDSNFKINIILSYKFKNLFILQNKVESLFGLNTFIKKTIYEKKYFSFFLKINNKIIILNSFFLNKNIFLSKTKKSLNSIFFNCINAKKMFFCSAGAGSIETGISVLTNYYKSFEKKVFNNFTCFNKKKIINNNYYMFNYLFFLNKNYNIFYYLFIFKIKFIKIILSNKIIIKTKKISYKKILFFLYYIKLKKFFILKII